MTVNEIYRSYLSKLSSIYERSEAAAITAIIFSHFTLFNRSDIIKNPDTILQRSMQSKLEQYLDDLMNYIPVQYITGESLFAGLTFKVNPSVLIPRPETEELVQLAGHFINGRNLSVIDIGTGSGCIAIALKKQQPAIDITAIDISKEAILLARQNAMTNDCVITFIEKDFLGPDLGISGTFDVIISNPPYIPMSELPVMDRHVTLSEPSIALFVTNEDPLVFYRRIAAFAKIHLHANGSIFLECFEEMAGDVAKLLMEYNFNSVVKKDIFEKERMVIATHFR